MATNMDDEVCCHICYDYYKHPKRLPCCRHSYCLECLRKVSAVAEHHRVLHCPECRQEQVLDSDGVDGLDTDTELDDRVKQLSCADCGKPCNTKQCGTCHEYCCPPCLARHQKAVCPILEQLRKIEKKLPTEQEKKKVKDLKQEWFRYKTELPKLKEQVNQTFDEYIQLLKRRRDDLLTQLKSESTLSEGRLLNLQELDTCAELLKQQREKLKNSAGTITALSHITEKNQRMDTMLDNMAELLTPPPQLCLHDNGLTSLVENLGSFVRRQDGIDYEERGRIRRILESRCTEPVWDVAVCPLTGNICATEKNHVRVYSARGDFQHRFYTGVFPARLTVNNRGQIIVGHFRENRVRAYDQQGRLLFEFGSVGNEDGQFRGPRAIHCDGDDNMYIADMHNHRIAIHGRDGTFIKNIGDSVLSEPLGVAINSRGEIFVSDTHANSIYQFDRDGVVMNRVSEAGDRGIVEPMGIYIDQQDNLLVCNNDDHQRIEIFNSDLNHIGSLQDVNNPFRFLLGVVVTIEKEILITDYGKKEILVF